jgi:hypothetical protein
LCTPALGRQTIRQEIKALRTASLLARRPD